MPKQIETLSHQTREKRKKKESQKHVVGSWKVEKTKKENQSEWKQERREEREKREGNPSFFGERGDQHILYSIWVTSPVCHFDTSPLNVKAD